MRNIIFFDLDGTLINSTDAILEAFGVAFNHFQKEAPNEDKIKALVGHPLDFMFLHLGVKELEVPKYVEAYKKHYRKISKLKTQFLPFAKEAIIEASRFATLGVVTTKTGLYSKELLEYMGVMEYFNVLIGRENVTHPKPHPEPILKAMKILNAKREFCWMIGDTPMDIISAKDAGIKSIGVVSEYSSKEELKRYTKIVKESAYEAVKYILAENERVKVYH